MGKSRRQRGYSRELESFRRRADKLIATIDKLCPASEKTPYELERERAETQMLKSIFTPEYVQDFAESAAYLARMDEQMRSWTGRLVHDLQQRRPSGLGSYRTKRLRKKMHAYWERER